MSCQSLYPADNANKAGVGEAQKEAVTSAVAVHIGGIYRQATQESCIREINKTRRHKVVLGTSEKNDYVIYFNKYSPGYVLRLEKKGMIMQTARALSEYEIPLAAAAITQGLIPDN